MAVVANPRRAAREQAGLTPQQVAKKARISVDYYRQVERKGRAHVTLADRLSRILRCRIEYFIYFP